jgi:hypothetical protein
MLSYTMRARIMKKSFCHVNLSAFYAVNHFFQNLESRSRLGFLSAGNLASTVLSGKLVFVQVLIIHSLTSDLYVIVNQNS